MLSRTLLMRARGSVSTRRTVYQRYMTSESTAAAKPPTTTSTQTTTTTAQQKVQQQQPSMLPRVIGFSVFSLSLGLIAVSYTLMTDEATLFWARDKYPKLVNMIAPVLGLPQEAPRDLPTEEEEYQPTDIKEIVGESVHIAAKMASGQVVVLECSAHETPEGINKIATLGRPGDRVLDVAILEKERALELMKKDPFELGREMNVIRIPDIPEVVSVHTLEVALALCREMERDLQVRIKLARNENDVLVLQRGISELEQRKRVLKDMIKVESKKQGIRSLFRRY